MIAVSEADLFNYESVCDTEWEAQSRHQKRAFGWPADGGVWVLRMPLGVEVGRWERNGSLVDVAELELTERGITPEETADGGPYLGALDGVETMEMYCEKLKELGAKFYAKVRDSPEVREARLLDDET